ncbi:hypothetical protein Zmor_004520 [Zophobas morio]|uniref:WD repeat-containing protein 55 homolog n=1 Tax=Zophobas morio TaxID=2755281 RepID=A0AA38HLP8_9CUCU|nr:hypothetical protein Zmor_004520 [Zophobas morio]
MYEKIITNSYLKEEYTQEAFFHYDFPSIYRTLLEESPTNYVSDPHQAKSFNNLKTLFDLLYHPAALSFNQGTPIYSIHWHPDNQRFVTAGDSVKVWSVLSLFKESTDKDEKGHKLLCTISYHIGSVNCARFSVDGRFLATGGDDKSVILCEVKTGYATKVFGSSDKNYENWVIRKTFKGHSADVVDLAWKPKGAPLLASASLDSTVIVWNSATLGSRFFYINYRFYVDCSCVVEQQAVLRGHTNMVKGVSWDPIGEFIATQSDDRSVIIWRTRDWSIEARITRGFENTSSSTFFRRPRQTISHWSPDGSYIVAAHARKDKLPVAAVIKRNSWALAYGFVGHERPVSVVSWNRHFYNAVDKPTAYCAVGGQDNALTIWSNRKARAVVGARDIFADSIVDLAWSGEGLNLLCCSLEGSVVLLSFEEKELGRKLSPKEVVISRLLRLRALPQFYMESPASFLHATNEYLLIITVNGRCSVWLFFLRNVLQGAAVLRRVPMDHLCYQNKGAALEQESIEGESALLSCLITPKGMPAIITSALHAYLYDNELGAWILVAREDDPITSSSDFYNSFPPLVCL